MCGRFTLTRSAADVAEHFDLAETPELAPRFNVAPGQAIATVSRGAGALPLQLEMRSWGLVPSWARDPAIAGRLVNARIETAAVKPAFRDALRRRRCLIPADGFYEWHGGVGQRSALHFALPGGALFGMAGLYEIWEDPAGESVASCTILTSEANAIVAPIHPRMPVILDREAWSGWLDPTLEDGEGALARLRWHEADRLVARRVGHRVDDARHEGPDCLEPDPQGVLRFDR